MHAIQSFLIVVLCGFVWLTIILGLAPAVKVRISPGWARWVGEKTWHESQRAKKNGDGSLELSFRVASLEEIKRWVLSFGPDVLVLEPERLKGNGS